MLKGRRGSKAVTPSQGVPRGGGGGGGSSGSGGGGGQAFDPRLIFTQIAALQSFHYAILSLFLQFSSVLFGRRPATLDAVFASGGLELWSSDAASARRPRTVGSPSVPYGKSVGNAMVANPDACISSTTSSSLCHGMRSAFLGSAGTLPSFNIC